MLKAAEIFDQLHLSKPEPPAPLPAAPHLPSACPGETRAQHDLSGPQFPVGLVDAVYEISDSGELAFLFEKPLCPSLPSSLSPVYSFVS